MFNIQCCLCRLESYKEKEKTCLVDGVQFLMKICQEALESVEQRDRMITEYVSYINDECIKFDQGLDNMFKQQ